MATCTRTVSTAAPVDCFHIQADPNLRCWRACYSWCQNWMQVSQHVVLWSTAKRSQQWRQWPEKYPGHSKTRFGMCCFFWFREDKEQQELARLGKFEQIWGCPNVRTCIIRHLKYKAKIQQIYQENIGFRLTVDQEVGYKMAWTSLNHSCLLWMQQRYLKIHLGVQDRLMIRKKIYLYYIIVSI